ncbi:MAG: hypothetical protein KGP14_04030 [Betaproteobacteria bacterium]|nr:hypothetical protein [Betaproteobacteria bacterium]
MIYYDDGSPAWGDGAVDWMPQSTSSGTWDWLSNLGSGLATGIGNLASNPATLAALAGGAVGSMNGAKQTGTQTVTQTPWAPMQPYLTGLAQDANTNYANSQWGDKQQALTDNRQSSLSGRNWAIDQAANTGMSAMQGAFDPKISPVSNIQGVPAVDFAGTLNRMGGANPMQSIQQMLSGQVNTSALDPVVNNAMRRMGENFNEQVMPSINQGAVAAGQYGGSRQGIAQGLAAKGLAYSMGDTAANMYNNAFNTAQGNMYGTANNMAGLGLSNAQSNANRDLSTQQFNANLSLQNNAQAMAQSQQQMANRQAGMGMMGTAYGLSDNNYNQQIQNLNAPQDYNYQNMAKYGSLINPLAGMGSSQSSPIYSNQTAGLLGGALTGAQIYGLLNK